MRVLSQCWQQFCARRHSVLAVLLLAAILHSAGSLVGQFYADDFIQRSNVVGSEALSQKGLLISKAHDFSSFVANQFNFFSPDNANFKAMKAFGMMPWWSGEDVSLRFFRPVAAATHFLDYSLWPDSPRLMHTINLLWYLAALAMIYAFYRRLSVSKTLALTALLLVILDASVYQIESWIASRSMLMLVCFGFACLYAYDKGVSSKRWYAAALVIFVLCLFTAEAVIGICAYLGAYYLVLDSRPWLKKTRALLPFAVLTLLWHWLYVRAGFGAYGVDFYLDPGQQPSIFWHQAVFRLPSNFFLLATGLDFFSGQIRPDIRQFEFALAGIGLFAVWLYWLWPLLKQDKTVRFWAVACLLALVPSLTIALAPRTLFLPNIAFAVLLAYSLKMLVQRSTTGLRKLIVWLVSVYVLLIHVLLSLFVAVWVMTITPVENALTQTQKPQGYIDLGTTDIANKHVVVVNAMQPFWLIFMAYQLDYYHQALPQSVRLLATSFYPLSLTRLSDNLLNLTARPALQLDRQPVEPLADKPAGHFIYLTWELLGLMRSEHTPWHEGQCSDSQAMTICVTGLHQGKPSHLLISLKQPLSNYRWVYQAMPSQQFKPFELPAIGHSVEFKGLFNPKAPSK